MKIMMEVSIMKNKTIRSTWSTMMMVKDIVIYMILVMGILRTMDMTMVMVIMHTMDITM